MRDVCTGPRVRGLTPPVRCALMTGRLHHPRGDEPHCQPTQRHQPRLATGVVLHVGKDPVRPGLSQIVSQPLSMSRTLIHQPRDRFVALFTELSTDGARVTSYRPDLFTDLVRPLAYLLAGLVTSLVRGLTGHIPCLVDSLAPDLTGTVTRLARHLADTPRSGSILLAHHVLPSRRAYTPLARSRTREHRLAPCLSSRSPRCCPATLAAASLTQTKSKRDGACPAMYGVPGSRAG